MSHLEKKNGRKLSALQSSVYYHRDPALASEIAAGSQLLVWLNFSPNFMGKGRECEKNRIGMDRPCTCRQKDRSTGSSSSSLASHGNFFFSSCKNHQDEKFSDEMVLKFCFLEKSPPLKKQQKKVRHHCSLSKHLWLESFKIKSLVVCEEAIWLEIQRRSSNRGKWKALTKKSNVSARCIEPWIHL